MHQLSRFARPNAVIALVVGFMVASPALAALPFDMPFTGKGLPLRDWMLMGSLALLAIALAIKLLRGRDADEALREGPDDVDDLRWWRNQ